MENITDGELIRQLRDEISRRCQFGSAAEHTVAEKDWCTEARRAVVHMSGETITADGRRHARELLAATEKPDPAG